ncbi:MAG TPA: hypothetical protein VND65_20900 [Candidatus Binatia bacterium]|nr:hypothetical protein [Candidatus Binatia bacterium]
MDNLIPIFIAITGAAVLLQAGVLVGIYLAMRKSTERMEALATEVKGKAIPALEKAQSILAEIQPVIVELRPKVVTVSENIAETSSTVRAQIQRVDATVNDVVDRARLQIIRADELLSRTLDRVEETSEIVHKTVVSPVRQVSGIIQGVTAGLEFLLAHRNRKNGGSREGRGSVQQDELFI